MGSDPDATEGIASADAALAALVALHEEIDREVGRLANKHAERLRCGRGCSACCLDDLTVTAVEAERIRRAHPDLLRKGQPGALGGCAFLDADGSCRVYADRPAVCRSQGLPLRFLFENEEDEIEEGRDICPLNLEGGPPLDTLPEADFWLVGPIELRLVALADAFAAVASEASGEQTERVALRGLFERSDARVNEADRSGASTS